MSLKHLSGFRGLKKLGAGGLFKSIIVLPKVKFETQERKEKVVLMIRKHPFVLIRNILVAVGYLFLGFFIVYMFSEVVGGIPARMMFAFYLLNIGIFVLSVWYSYVKWYFNIFMATTQRIVDLDFVSILDARWSETRLVTIEDVSVSTPGFWSVFFDIGNLFVQTASAKNEFEIKEIPKPLRVQDVIMDLVTAIKHEDNISSANVSVS